MSTRILWDPSENVACLYDSVTGAVFGEVFAGEESYEDAEHFLDWLTNWMKRDARSLTPDEFSALRAIFFSEKPMAA